MGDCNDMIGVVTIGKMLMVVGSDSIRWWCKDNAFIIEFFRSKDTVFSVEKRNILSVLAVHVCKKM